MRELVVISGKGGTGKTSLTASFAVLAGGAVLADCDVDASNLQLVLSPRVMQRRRFVSGHEASIRQEDCLGCGACATNCRFDAVKVTGRPPGLVRYSVDLTACEGCGVCVRSCIANAIDFPERDCGEWMISDTRCGPMVHAQLGVAAENSGKLVTEIRREAHKIARLEGRPLVIVDGPPGIGCPVIASLTGATQVLAVTEPTVSGKHDLERLLSLTRHFEIPTSVCVNKWDINPELTDQIEEEARRCGASVSGRIRYDLEVTRAQTRQQAIVETSALSAADVERVWCQLGLQEC